MGWEDYFIASAQPGGAPRHDQAICSVCDTDRVFYAEVFREMLLELYQVPLLDERAASDDIIYYLKECQTGTARIPGLLPKGTDVAHKSGTISGSINDTGIVFLPDGSHVAITVFMKNTRATTAARERVIADISRDAYDYFLRSAKP